VRNFFEGAQQFRKVRILENLGDFFEDAHRFARCAPKTAHLREGFFGNMAGMMAESRTRVFWLVTLTAVIAFAASIVTVRADSQSPEGIEFFEKKVRPILVEKCQKCHGSQRQKGGLRLDSREAAFKGGETGSVIVAGHPEKSELVKAVNYEADGFQMPPTGKLDADSISVLTDWVRRGAPWPQAASSSSMPGSTSPFNFAERARHWSFQPLRSGAPPQVAPDWASNPIDAFIASRLSQAKLGPSPPAGRRTLLRRITFDLTGLPPTPREIDEFLADRSINAYERVVERLLASPHYGVRWGRHWLDLVRYAETYGHEYDFEKPPAWPYRDYVVRALNADVPYDLFVTEHIAGDLLPTPRRDPSDAKNESVIGTAFWWLGQGKHSPVDIRAEQCDTIDNQIDVFGKAFLGLSIACARCHDHKFDPIRTQDYYALSGILRSSREQVAFLDNPKPVEQFADWRQTEETRFRLLVAKAMRTHAHFDLSTSEPDPDGVLIPWRKLASLPAGPQFIAARSQLAQQLRANDAGRGPGEILFEDFSKPGFSGWQVSGPAFGHRPSRAGDVVVGDSAEHPVAQIAPQGAAHSGLISPALCGSIRSRSFTVEKPFIHYRASRHHAIEAPQRELKSGQLNLIVDGFQIIRSPLWGQLSLTVENDAPTRWYTQDVSKLRGERGYIEIVDEDDGWIVVDSIVFSDSPQPPAQRPNRLAAAMLDDSAIDRPEKLAAGYQRLFAETVERWAHGSLANDADAADRGAILAWICQRRIEPVDNREARELAAMVADWHRQNQRVEPDNRVVAMVDGTGENEHVLVRGNHKKPGAEVPRRFLELFGPHPIDVNVRGSGRLQVAHEMTRSAAPLLARVIVNRLWQHHFGRGLVTPPDDFGKMGQPPTHPELLDYLAAELIKSGWSLKHMQRLMVLSSAYRMSSRETDSNATAVDPDNRLLHRMPVVRLEAEAIRDAILAVSGQFNEQLEGPSVPVHLDEFMTGRGRPHISGPLDGNGRRSIYLAVRRNFLTPLFLAFDYPATMTTAGRRGTSNVPAQALSLLNNPFVKQQSIAWAKRQSGRADRESLIDALYESAFGRPGSNSERTAAEQFLQEQASANSASRQMSACADLCHVLFNVKEFIYIE
jgi:Protein of unknown function (DUF1553)/Protein of unknown function (DUF1549)/Planctomycete cytochrome C